MHFGGIALMFIILLHLSVIWSAFGRDCMVPTKSCPTTKADWEARGAEYPKSHFPCNKSGLQYTCMLTRNDTLVETCIADNYIPKGYFGCPFIISCLPEYGPAIGSEKRFKQCPVKMPGCPPEDHTGYNLYELYKYPACLEVDRRYMEMTTFSTEKISSVVYNGRTHSIDSFNKSMTSTAKPSISNKTPERIIIGILVPLALVVITVLIIVFCRRKKNRNSQSAKEMELLNRDCKTPLLRAVWEGHVENVSELLDHGADANAVNKHQCTPLHLAAEKGQIDVVSVLLQRGANVNAKTETDSTPLHEAAEKKHADVVSVLLDHGANVNATNNYDSTPLHWAAETEGLDVISVLLDHGADANARNTNHRTPLHLAVGMGYVHVVSLLLDRGADVNAKNKEGKTPLHMAVQLEKVDVVSVLPGRGADVNAQTENHDTPLHLAAVRGRKDIVSILLQNGANANAMNKDGSTPLHMAAEGEHEEVISELLDHGADISAKDKDRENPLQYAVFHPIFDTPRIPDFIANTDNITISNREVANLFQEKVKEVLKEFRDIPPEVIAMGKEKVNRYRDNLRKGSIPCFHIRCMIVGHYGVGKTTLVKALLEERDANIESTDGIDVYRGLCFVNKDTGEWTVQKQHTEDFIGLEEFIQVDFWDFAGQALYYPTHPTYFSYRCLYLLTINLELGLQGEVEDYCLDPRRKMRSKVKDFLHFWIGSIIQYSGNKDGIPRIVVIGTHKDKIEDESRLERLVKEILEEFSPLVETKQLVIREDLFINALDPTDEDLIKIRDIIVKIGSAYPTFGERIPRECITVQRQLKVWRTENQTIVLPFNSLTDSLQGNSATSEVTYEMKVDDICLYLELYHSLGQILFFDVNILREKIILDPKWLIEAMRCLITRRSSSLDTNSSNPGILEKSLMLELWTRSDEQFHKHSEHLLLSLEKLDFICRPKSYDEDGNDKDVDFYYVPSMVDECGFDSNKPVGHTAMILGFEFKKNLLPPAVFYRLVCYCLAKWPVYKTNLFCDQVIIELSNILLLHLKRRENKIETTFFYRNQMNNEAGENTINYLAETLDRILKSYTPARLEGSSEEWYEIVGKGKLPWNRLLKTKTEKNVLKQRGEPFSKSSNELDTSTQITEKLLMLVAWSVGENSHDGIQKRIREDLPPQSKEPLEHGDLACKEKTLLLLNEWKIYHENEGAERKPSSLCDFVDRNIVIEAVHQSSQQVRIPYLKTTMDHVNDKILDAVALVVGDKCFPVGIGLGLTISEIKIHRRDHIKDTMGFNQSLLRHWSNTRTGEATVGNLARVLIETNCSIHPLR